MSEAIVYLACAYLGFGAGFAWVGTKEAISEIAGLGTPGEVATAGVITFVVGTIAWPFFFRRIKP